MTDNITQVKDSTKTNENASPIIDIDVDIALKALRPAKSQSPASNDIAAVTKLELVDPAKSNGASPAGPEQIFVPLNRGDNGSPVPPPESKSGRPGPANTDGRSPYSDGAGPRHRKPEDVSKRGSAAPESDGIKESISLRDKMERIEQFKSSWEGAVTKNGLEKSPLGPVIDEVGNQLTSGKLNAERLQNLMKNVKVTLDDLGPLMTKVNEFNKEMSSKYGIEVQFNARGTEAEIAFPQIVITEPIRRGDTPLSIFVPQDKAPVALEERIGVDTYVEPKLVSLEAAMKRLQANVLSGPKK